MSSSDKSNPADQAPVNADADLLVVDAPAEEAVLEPFITGETYDGIVTAFIGDDFDNNVFVASYRVKFDADGSERDCSIWLTPHKGKRASSNLDDALETFELATGKQAQVDHLVSNAVVGTRIQFYQSTENLVFNRFLITNTADARAKHIARLNAMRTQNNSRA